MGLRKKTQIQQTCSPGKGFNLGDRYQRSPKPFSGGIVGVQELLVKRETLNVGVFFVPHLPVVVGFRGKSNISSDG